MSRRAIARVAPVLLAAGVLAAGGAVATAHAGLKGTSPARGAVVKHLPSTIRITFDAAILGARSVAVLDAAGRDHATSVRLNPRNAGQVLVRTTGDRIGRYRVRWAIVSADAHRESGAFGFRVKR